MELFGISEYPWTLWFSVSGSSLVMPQKSLLNIPGMTDIKGSVGLTLDNIDVKHKGG